MIPVNTDGVFSGSIPQLYEQYMVPLIFEPYADDLAARIGSLQPSSVLEVAAGTGVLTRRLARILPPGVRIVATDLNQPMIDQAQSTGTARAVEWQQADGMQLPFAAESFDAVVCQFGIMFFPDKPAAMAEALRVLKPGGAFLFNAWDRIQHNEFSDTVTDALAEVFPENPPRFMARVAHAYHELELIRDDLRRGGFVLPATIETLSARSRADSPQIPAVAYCQGTPLRNEIEARDAAGLADATAHAAAAIARRFGSGRVDSKIQAHIVSVTRPGM